MKKLVYIFLLIIPQFSYSQRTLTDKQWIEDLDYIINRIDTVHPNLCTDVISREQMEKRVKELKEKFSVLSDNEILVELFKIIATIHDGHTRLHGKNLTKKWYPVRIEKFSAGYYITAITNELSKYIGAKVLAINNQTVEMVFEKLIEITPGDNAYGQEYFAPMYLTMTSMLSGLHIIKSTDDALIITLKSRDNKDDKISISPVKFVTGDDLSWFWKDYAAPTARYSNIMQVESLLPYYLQNYNKPYWYTDIKEKTVYFAFNACENKKEFNMFNARLWQFIDSLAAENLIIDLRNNFGGTNSINEPLLHEIIKHDRINRKGHLFVITSKKTFSAALHCATWIEFHCTPIFVGEPTGAGPNHYADPDFSVLPNSKILLMISKYYWQNSWPWDKRKFIDPTIKVNLSSEDYFNYKDPAMDKIFEYTKQKQQ